MANKKFTIKIYDNDGTTFIRSLKPSEVKSVPSFTSQINGGFGQCSLDLNLPFDDFGEGTEVDFMNIVNIYVTDDANTLGRLVYRGFISAYVPYVDGAKQGVKVTLLGLVSLLSFAYYKNGASFTVAHATVDPSVILKAIIDHFNSVYTGSLLGYNSGATTVDSVGVSVAYTFIEKKWNEALQDGFGTVGAGWWWHIDKQGQLYLKQKPSSATHKFTIGKDIESIEVTKSAEKVNNAVRVKYGASTVDYSDATSITRFGTREVIVTDDQIQDATTATQRGAQQVNDNKVEKIKAKITLNLNYDLELIKVGDTCEILNLSKNQSTFNNNMLIVSVAYSFEKVVIELEEETKFSIELQKFIS